MHDLLADACLYARAKGLRNAICIMPPEATNPGFRDWDRAASIPGLDDFGTDPYWFSFGGSAAEYVGRHAKATVEVARPPRARPPRLDPGVRRSRGSRGRDRPRDRRGGRGRRAQHRRLVVRRLRRDVDLRVRRPGRPSGRSSGSRSGGSAASGEGLPVSVYGVALRELGPDDEREIVALWQACAGDLYPLRARLWRQLTADNPDFQPSDVIVAAADLGEPEPGTPKPLGPLVGFGYLGRSRGLVRGRRGWAHEGWLQIVAVTPGRQREGIGRAIVTRLVADAQAEGITRVRLGGGIHYLFPGVPVDLPGARCLLRGARRPVRRREPRPAGIPRWDRHDRPRPGRPGRRRPDGPSDGSARGRGVPRVPGPPVQARLGPRSWAGRWTTACRPRTSCSSCRRTHRTRRSPRDGWPASRRSTSATTRRSSGRGSGRACSSHRAAVSGPIGVVERLRGRGLGRALLAVALDALHERGVRDCVIDWTGLLGYYGPFGFTPWKTYVEGELPL